MISVTFIFLVKYISEVASEILKAETSALSGVALFLLPGVDLPLPSRYPQVLLFQRLHGMVRQLL